MIINHLNLISFGKFKNKELDFSDSLNIVYGSNESGKSTVSAFIEAMFYSYPPHDKDRGKYYPWDSSLPSGSMTVTQNSKTHTIFRSFGPNPKSDVLHIEPDLSLSDVLPDRETFRKSVYCSEGKASDFGKTVGMDVKIANLMSTGDENINAQSAILFLNEQKKRYIRRGNSGELSQIQNRISELENELSSSRSISESLSSQNIIIEEKKRNISSLKNLLATLESDINSLTVEENELSENIIHQKEYISSLSSQSSQSQFQKKSCHVLPYVLFSTVLFIICLIFNPKFIFLSLCPLLFGFFKRFLSKKQPTTTVNQNNDPIYREAVEDLTLLLAKKSSITEKVSSKRQKITSLQKSLLDEQSSLHSIEKSTLNFSHRPIDQIESELAYTKSVADEIRKKVRAIDAAIESLSYATERFSEDFTPVVSQTAMEYISRIAPKNSRSLSLVLDAENSKNPLSISVKDPLPQSLSSYSFGFRQEVYLCCRIALSQFLFGDDFPLIIDDPFLGSDHSREKSIIDLLLEISKKRQIIIFTNRKNEYFNHLNCNFIDIDH